jgi:4-aminobutyrate aminotransferase
VGTSATLSITGKETRPRVAVPIPGPRAKAIVARDDRFLVTTTKHAPIVAARARGAVVEDVDGNVLLDFASGIGVVNTGHCHPRVVRAVQEQAERLIHFAGTDFYYEQQAELAERLDGLVPVEGPTRTFFAQSGTEANEAAIKLAKAGTGRPLLLAFLGAFHGRTQGSLSLTASKAVHHEGFFSSMPGVVHTPFPNPYRNPWRIDGYAEPDELAQRAIEHIETLFETILPPRDCAAVFWEPVQGEGGYVVPPRPFPRLLRQLCDEHGILLVADEVQTGFGRTGRWFGSEHFGVKADIVSLAKAMGSGYPIGAAVARAGLDFKRKGQHSNTYGGNVLGCAASLATLAAIEEEDMVENAQRVGERVGRRLLEMKEAHPRVGDARGLGLMRALEFVRPDGRPDPELRDAVEEQCWRRGLITLGCGRSSLRLIPPLNITQEQADGGLDVLAEALRAAQA